MTTVEHDHERRGRVRRVALVGNPNVGKSTIFGRLAGARVHTSNFPGTTQTAETTRVGGVELIDLPGTYSLDDESPEAAVCRGALAGRLSGGTDENGGSSGAPDAVVVVVDAANLSRNLKLVGEVFRLGRPAVVVLNRIDQAERRGLTIDTAKLSEALGCVVLVTNGLTGDGVDSLLAALDRAGSVAPVSEDRSLRDWAETIGAACSSGSIPPGHEGLTDRLDDVLTHPAMGGVVFAAVMFALFWSVFKIAAYPMDWIDHGFAWLGDLVGGVLPGGAVRSLLVDGVIAGVGATVIFLPQICLMFFLITLLEHSGYLPRAALLIDRLLRPFGLPGQAFVPLLSSHACAIPGIIACRGIPDRLERLTTILIAPFMSCTARIPVYVLLTSLLFSESAAKAALAFAGCYVLGAAVALATAAVLRRGVLRGAARPMAIELPSYRRPSVRQALVSTGDRAWLFLRKAGTVILGMVVALWWLGEYPQVDPPAEVAEIRERAGSVAPGDPADRLLAEADRLEARHASANSFMGRAGRSAAPVFEPIGYDWQLTVGVLSSFAAREVFVSTMAVVLEADEDSIETAAGLERIGSATRDDGVTPVFTDRAAWSLLVFYVLAMQCLPTLAVTAREAGGWRWAGLQLGYMTVVAYAGALVAYHVSGLLG